MIKLLLIIFKTLPELIELVRRLEQTTKNERIKDDLQEINKAFAERDATKLNELFSSVPDKK